MQFACDACGNVLSKTATACRCGAEISVFKTCTHCNGKGNAGKPRPPLRHYIHPDDYVKCPVCQGLGNVAATVRTAAE